VDVKKLSNKVSKELDKQLATRNYGYSYNPLYSTVSSKLLEEGKNIFALRLFAFLFLTK